MAQQPAYERIAEKIIENGGSDLPIRELMRRYGVSHTTAARARRMAMHGHPDKTDRPKSKGSNVPMIDVIMEFFETKGTLPKDQREILDNFAVSKATAARALKRLRERQQTKNVREKSRKPTKPKQRDPQVIRIEIEVPETAEIKLRRNGVFCTIIATEDGAAFLPRNAKKMTKIVSWERLYKLAEVLS